jgi:hypothetical protein
MISAGGAGGDVALEAVGVAVALAADIPAEAGAGAAVVANGKSYLPMFDCRLTI